MDFLKEFAFLAPYGTTLGVAVAVWQIFRNSIQQRTSFEDSLTKEYREITRRIPYKALVDEEVCEDDQLLAYNEIYNYMDLCNEQIFLRMSGRVSKKTWNNWQEGMSTNFSLKVFDRASKEVFRKLDQNFKELKRVQESEYKTDPRKWKNV
ncbi:hypothetical protein NFI08_15505 [Halomonas sp. EF61]|uniref:hypothetical protein n=1 Tax=Halomonas sp. EF61 TaxID=2950869 RepID=UPI0032E054A8